MEDEDKARALFIADLADDEPEYKAYLNRLDPQKKERINNHVNRMTTGLHATAPIMCAGPDKCPFIAHCPIPERSETGIEFGPESNYPLFRPCILEKFYMKQKVIDYIQHLSVDPADPFEMAVVQELALVDLLKNRAMMIVSAGDKDGEGKDLMKTDITGFNPETGQASAVTKLHPLTDFVEKLEKRRQYWSSQLIETRKSKFEKQAKIGDMKEDSKLLGEITQLKDLLGELAQKPKALIVDDLAIKIDD